METIKKEEVVKMMHAILRELSKKHPDKATDLILDALNELNDK